MTLEQIAITHGKSDTHFLLLKNYASCLARSSDSVGYVKESA